MRIGIFTDTYLPDINGVVSSIELTKKGLEKLGHEVFIFATYKGLKIKREGNLILLPGVEIKKFYGYKIAQPIHLLLIDEIKELNLDIIHAQTEFGVGTFASIVASTLNIPLIRTYHTTYEDYTHYLNFLNSKTIDEALKVVVAKLSKLYGDNCSMVIVPSNKTKQMLLRYEIKTPIEVIPTGLTLDIGDNYSLQEIEKLKQKYKKDFDKLLLFVGRIAKEKALDLLLDGFVKVKKENLKIKLLIIGDGPELDELKQEDVLYIDENGCTKYAIIPVEFYDKLEDLKQLSEEFSNNMPQVKVIGPETEELTYEEYERVKSMILDAIEKAFKPSAEKLN